jgi:hypothetical protein
VNPKPFLLALSKEDLSQSERAVALLWWYGLENPTNSRSVSDLAQDMQDAGYPKQNTSRLRLALQKDRRTSKDPNGGFRIRVTARDGMDVEYNGLLTSRPVETSNSVLPLDLFDNTRGYIERVVAQVNSSYDYGLYDCCTVMCRRLLETLIIEAFEYKKNEAHILGSDGHYVSLSNLVSAIGTGGVSLSRNGMHGLKAFKKLGDLSAHNRRYNARKDDIDRVRDGIRVTSEELLKQANLGE